MIEAAGHVTAEGVGRAIGRPVASVRRRDWDYHSSHGMQELDVELTNGSRLAMIFKGGESADAQRTRPEFLYNPRREIDVYRDVLAKIDLDTPTFYGATIDEDPGQPRYRLFIEHLRDAIPLWQCDFDLWPAAARWLKRLHSVTIDTLPKSLLRHDETFYWKWMERAAEHRAELRGVAKHYGDIVKRLVALPKAFIHGEFYPSNIMVQDNRRIRPIDWETAANGPALMDLAALCSGRFDESRRREAAEAYGADVRDLDICRLHLAIQWLGWSKDWTPPKEHQQNWLAEAMELAAKLGVCR